MSEIWEAMVQSSLPKFYYVSCLMMQWAAKLELEKEEASSFKANVLEPSCALQIFHLTAEEREHQNKETKIAWEC